LPRVTLDGWARVLEAGTPAWEVCRAAYVERFPDVTSGCKLIQAAV